MKMKIEISICTGLMLNDHSNPYIESTTVLSDIHDVSIYMYIQYYYYMQHSYTCTQHCIYMYMTLYVYMFNES